MKNITFGVNLVRGMDSGIFFSLSLTCMYFSVFLLISHGFLHGSWWKKQVCIGAGISEWVHFDADFWSGEFKLRLSSYEWIKILNDTGLSSLHIELCLIALKRKEFCALQNANEVLFRVFKDSKVLFVTYSYRMRSEMFLWHVLYFCA